MRREYEVFCQNKEKYVQCMDSARTEGSSRVNECPRNVSRREKVVLRNITVKVRHEEDLT